MSSNLYIIYVSEDVYRSQWADDSTALDTASSRSRAARTHAMVGRWLGSRDHMRVCNLSMVGVHMWAQKMEAVPVNDDEDDLAAALPCAGPRRPVPAAPPPRRADMDVTDGVWDLAPRPLFKVVTLPPGNRGR